MKTRSRTCLGMIGIALWLTACANGGSQDSIATAGTANAGITVTDAWVRPAPLIERASAAYMAITNSGSTDDQLISVTSDVAAIAELHESMDQDGMMAMSPMEGVTIPANGQTELKPGSYHVMLMELTSELKVGDTVSLRLKFEKAGEITVSAEVRDD